MLGRGNTGFNLADVVEARGFDPAKVDIRFNYQALSTMAVRGGAAAAWPEMERPFAKTIGELQGRGFKGPFVLADGRPVHDAGGSEAQELAFALAVALAYLRTLEAGGLALDAALIHATRYSAFSVTRHGAQKSYPTEAEFVAFKAGIG